MQFSLTYKRTVPCSLTKYVRLSHRQPTEIEVYLFLLALTVILSEDSGWVGGWWQENPRSSRTVRTVDTVIKSKETLYQNKMGDEDRCPKLFFDPHTWYVQACIHTHEHAHTCTQKINWKKFFQMQSPSSFKPTQRRLD